MYIGFRWNESILPPPIVDWSPKLTAGSRSSNLKSPWDGEINTRPHGAHANDQSLCSLPATQRLHVPTLDMSGIPLCSSRGFTTTTQGTHWSGGWLRLGTDGNRFFDSYFTLLHCGFNGNKMKQIYFMISVYSLYIIYIYLSIYLSYVKYVWSPRKVSSIGTKGAKKVGDLAWAPCSQPIDLWISPTSPHKFAQFYLQPRRLGLRDIPSWKAKGVLMFLKGFLLKPCVDGTAPQAFCLIVDDVLSRPTAAISLPDHSYQKIQSGK